MLRKGDVVRSCAGRDKNRYYVVVDVVPGGVFIADGKVRKLETPKRKNLKHIRTTHRTVALEEIFSNKALRKKLESMNQAL